jgi:hypothetical protein
MARLTRPTAECRDSDTAARRAGKASAQTLRLGGGRALRLAGSAAMHYEATSKQIKSDRKRNEWIAMSRLDLFF